MGWCFWNISSMKRLLNIVDTISFITWMMRSQSCNVLFLTPVTCRLQRYMYIWWLTIFLLWIYWHLGRLVRFNSLSCESLVKEVYLYLICIFDVLYMIWCTIYFDLRKDCRSVGASRETMLKEGSIKNTDRTTRARGSCQKIGILQRDF